MSPQLRQQCLRLCHGEADVRMQPLQRVLRAHPRGGPSARRAVRRQLRLRSVRSEPIAGKNVLDSKNIIGVRYPRSVQIDRTRFLLLTATIASCAPQPADTADAEVEMVDIEPSGNDPFVVERTSSAGEPEQKDAQCRALRPPPGPHCESFDETVEDCQRYRAVLEPTAAEQASA